MNKSRHSACKILFVIAHLAHLTASEMQTTHTPEHFDDRVFFNELNTKITPAVLPIICSYLDENYDDFHKKIHAFMNKCPYKEPVHFDPLQMCFLQHFLKKYERGYNTIFPLQQNSLAQKTYASLSDHLQKCIVTHCSTLPPRHKCHHDTFICNEHITLPLKESTTNFNYHSTMPQPLSVNCHGDVLIRRQAVLSTFFSCLYKNGKEVPLLHDATPYNTIPTYGKGVALWSSSTPAHAIILNVYERKDIPKETFNFHHLDPSLYLVTCHMVDVSENCSIVRHNISPFTQEKYALFFAQFLHTPIAQLPLEARYCTTTNTLYIRTAPALRFQQLSLLITFSQSSNKGWYAFQNYPPEIAWPDNNPISHHISRLPHNYISKTISLYRNGFTVRSDASPLQMPIALMRTLVPHAPILWNQEHTRVLLATQESQKSPIIWKLINLQEYGKKAEKKKNALR